MRLHQLNAVVLWVLAASLLYGAESGPVSPTPSQPVHGLTASLELRQSEIVNGTRILSTYLTLANVSDVANPLRFDFREGCLTFEVVDEQGKAVTQAFGPYDGPYVEVGVLVLPFDSRLTMNLAQRGLGIPGGKAALIDLGSSYNWALDASPKKKYFLRGVLAIKRPDNAEGQRYWEGQISIPPAEIPLK